MKRVIYPGTFDPITNGHLDLIERAVKLFDELIITIAVNPAKKPLFSIDERKSLITEVLPRPASNNQISVMDFKGLLVDFAREVGATAIIRGLRAVTDFEYELQMALTNRRLADEITTVFMMPHERYTYLNSTIVKEVAKFGGDVSNFVPAAVEKSLRKKFANPSSNLK